jgi:dihydroflavonol-4-reductase
MQVVVTGASGHVGSVLVRALLSDGHSVTALFNSDRRSLAGLSLEARAVNIEDGSAVSSAIAGAEVVFHAAARVSLLATEDAATTRVNVEGTRNVVAACLEHGVRRLVHFSTIHALDERGELLRPGEGLSYERSKVEAERLVLDEVQRGLDAVVVSPCAVIGPFDFKPSYIGQVLQLQDRGLLLATVAGGQSWVDVRDVAKAAIAAAERGKTGSRYVISGHWRNIRELAEIASQAAGMRAPLFTLPKALLTRVAPLAERACLALGLPALLTQASMDALETSPRPMPRTAEQELGHLPRPLPETLADTMAWFRSERGG